MSSFQKATSSKRTIVSLYVIVFLQAFMFRCSKPKDPVFSSSIRKNDLLDKKSLTDTNTKCSITMFQSKLNSNSIGNYKSLNHSTYYKPTNNFNNDSGYSSNNKSNAQTKYEEIDFKKEIEKMREKGDERRHVIWTLSEDKLTRTVSKYSNSVYAPEDYGVIVLNIYRAAKKICELYKKNHLKSIISNDAASFLGYSERQFTSFPEEEDHWIETVKYINNEVVFFLKENVFPDLSFDFINKNLRLAENYVGFDDTHYDVTTIFTTRDKKIGLEDKKCFPLTTNQKNKIKNRHSEQWYKRLDPFEKELVNHYQSSLLLLGHKKFLPTQLRDLIGLRNAYEKNGEKTLLGQYYHSGSLASPNKQKDDKSIKADKEITKENWEQIQQNFKDKDIVCISLNRNLGGSDIPVFKRLSESKIVEDTLETVGYDHFMNFSINHLSTKPIFKHLVDKLPSAKQNINQNKHQQEQYNAAFESLKKASEESYITSWFKQNVPGAKIISNFFNKDITPSDKILFNREKLFNSNNFVDNPFLEATANYVLCATQSGKNIIISCKSGKDRTGSASKLADIKILEGRDPDLKKEPNLHRTIAHTGHYQLLPAINGGMPGRFGTKSGKDNAESYLFSKVLSCRAATLTSVPLHPNKKENFNNETNFSSRLCRAPAPAPAA